MVPRDYWTADIIWQHQKMLNKQPTKPETIIPGSTTNATKTLNLIESIAIIDSAKPTWMQLFILGENHNGFYDKPMTALSSNTLTHPKPNECSVSYPDDTISNIINKTILDDKRNSTLGMYLQRKDKKVQSTGTG